jgi:uncharacterized protein involved in response to NO
LWLVALAPAYRVDLLYIVFMGGFTLLILAVLARLGAAFAPESFFEHLAIAALLWIVGVLFWGMRIVQLILRRPLPGPKE